MQFLDLCIILSRKILNENGAEKYLKFLSSGSSKPPVELLKDAGFEIDGIQLTEVPW